MIPLYSRVAAIDDVEDHLQKIVWGLSRAGFCPLPFLFEDGALENAPEKPLVGMRVVFSDIHLVGGGPNNEKIHAANIIRCLKKIVSNGPYVLIFWSQFPGDSDKIAQLIWERAADSNLTPPIGYEAIDKNAVFNAGAVGSAAALDADKLRTLILDKVSRFKTIAVAASWEDRVAAAASRTTNRLFDLVRTSDKPSEDWEMLLGFLACEAVGPNEAKESVTLALDSALLPLLEDQLSLIGDECAVGGDDVQRLLTIVSSEPRVSCPDSVATAKLNTSYLVEELSAANMIKTWTRGVVTELSSGFINSGSFIAAFGLEESDLIRQEFATRDLNLEEKRKTKLHVVELGPECDHVQAKVTTHRFLLALLVPHSLVNAFNGGVKKKTLPRFKNDSVLDVGRLALKSDSAEEYHLLVSCRCFMALAAKTAVGGIPRLRLRRATLEELGHRYITHARRPGVMRFA